MGYLPVCKYHLWYDRIISQSLMKSRSVYTETHHIVPRSFFKQSNSTGWLDGNPDDSHNLVELTPREHYVCHKLLVRMTTGVAQRKMISALWRMANSRKEHNFITSREYQSIRELAVNNIKLTLKELWLNPEFRARQIERLSNQDRRTKIRNKMAEIRNRPEIKQKQSEINKSLWSNAEYKAKRLLVLAEVNRRPEKRKAQSLANKNLWTEEKRQTHIDKMKEIRRRPENIERQKEINLERYMSQNERDLQRKRMLKAHEDNPQLREDSKQRTRKLWAERSIEDKKSIGSKISSSKKAALSTGESHLFDTHICPYCRKSGKGPVMKRHHFDNCKTKAKEQGD